MNILGISCFYHDAAAAILSDGQLIAAAQEERFTRRRHDAEFPIHAINYCLHEAGISAAEIDYVGFYDKPLVKFERLLYTYLATFPKALPSFLKSMPVWLRDKLWIPQLIRAKLDYDGPILYSEHHQAHAASAFHVSPFDAAAILTIDGVGEWETTTYGIGEGNDIQLLKRIHFPHSLGLLYSAFTYYLGFRVNSAEYKVMGLAPYGKPVYYDLIMQNLVSARDDGSYKMNMKYFGYDSGLTMTNASFETLFGQPRREPEGPLGQFHKDMAASIQKVTDELMVRMANHVHRVTKSKNLCLAGGVALNCVANSKILERTSFENLFIQPAAGDAGGAVGVAYHIYNSLLGKKRNFVWRDAFLGPEFSDSEIAEYLAGLGVDYQTLGRVELLNEAARLIAEQNVIGWFQGRMEWGPRALGNRSILADPRNNENWSRVNLKIKFRESFRPFAPAVLLERASEFFDLDRPSPYMLLTAQVRENKRVIPAVTHVDGSARLQTVARTENTMFHDLLQEFDRQTGCPVLINTSFNVRGEPIVCTPHDAFKCFMRTDMDFLVIGNALLDKKRMQEDVKELSREEFAMD
ncbi:MAG: carbamoyltransferase [Ignavibacteriales bacterium]|nr:carbamoyltransferase [Ignavibacteriales bacterium]